MPSRHINMGSTKKQKSNEKLNGKGRWKGTSSKTPATAETEALEHSDEEQQQEQEQEVILNEVPDPRTQEEHHPEPEDHMEEDLQKMKKVNIPDSLTSAQEKVLVD